MNFASHADVSFLLIIFFVLFTTIGEDPGISERLLPWFQETTTASYPRENRFMIYLDEARNIWCQGRVVTRDELRKELEYWYYLHGTDQRYHLVLEYPPGSRYREYITAKDAILHAHYSARDALAELHYGYKFELLNFGERRKLRSMIPLRLSESTRIWTAKGETEPCEVLIY